MWNFETPLCPRVCRYSNTRAESGLARYLRLSFRKLLKPTFNIINAFNTCILSLLLAWTYPNYNLVISSIMLSQFSSNESIITSELRLVANDVLVSSVVKLWIVLSDDMLTPDFVFVSSVVVYWPKDSGPQASVPWSAAHAVWRVLCVGNDGVCCRARWTPHPTNPDEKQKKVERKRKTDKKQIINWYLLLAKLQLL